MPSSWAKEIQENLCQIRQYLKADFKLHISYENQCADHCRKYALSDDKPEFKEKCSHKHKLVCDRCEMISSTFAQIENAVSSKEITLRFVFIDMVAILSS